MTKRIVLQFSDLSRGDKGFFTTLQLLAPNGDKITYPFECPDPAEVFGVPAGGGSADSVVTDAGRRLFDALTRDIAVVNQAFGQPDPGAGLDLDLTAALRLQSLPWEAICDSGGSFLTLDKVPLTRLVGISRAGSADTAVERTLEGPLKILAVLSCVGINAREEWEALKDGLKDAPFPVKVRLLLSEPKLFSRITEDPAAPPRWLEAVKLIPADTGDLAALITEFAPHVVHFFCHGFSDGRPYLQVPHQLAWDVDADTALPDDVVSEFATDPDAATVPWHQLEARDVSLLFPEPPKDPWLIVLNACGSARTPESPGAVPEVGAAGAPAVEPAAGSRATRSLAVELVEQFRVPAVIGMREPVVTTDAARFTRTFYRSLLEGLAPHIRARAAAGVQLDWAAFTVKPRLALSGQRGQLSRSQVQARHKEWTLPAVIARPEPFVLTVAAPPSRGSETLESLAPSRTAAELVVQATAQLLAALPGDAPAETVAAFRLLQDQERRIANGGTR
jgi:hypothetical protein